MIFLPVYMIDLVLWPLVLPIILGISFMSGGETVLESASDVSEIVADIGGIYPALVVTTETIAAEDVAATKAVLSFLSTITEGYYI